MPREATAEPRKAASGAETHNEEQRNDRHCPVLGTNGGMTVAGLVFALSLRGICDRKHHQQQVANRRAMTFPD